MYQDNSKKFVDDYTSLNQDKFDDFFNEYWDQLFISAYNVLKDEAVCKDIIQDIFIGLWEKRDELQVTNIKAYLHQAVKFQVAKTLRDNKKFVAQQDLLETFIDAHETETGVEHKELSQIIDNSIQTLPDKCSTVFKLSRIEGISNKEIAQKLNISISTVENHINKALKILRSDLAGYNTIILLLLLFF